MHVKFFKDGVLRIQERYKNDASGKFDTHYFPFQAVEKSRGYEIFSGIVNYTVEFEDGLTVKEFFDNLRPWPEQMRALAVMDFPAFLEEIDKATPDNQKDDYLHGVISPYAEIDFDYSYVPKEKADIDIGDSNDIDDFSVLFDETCVENTSVLSVDKYWDFSVHTKTVDPDTGSNIFSYSYVPIRFWAYMPLILKDQGRIYDRTVNDKTNGYKKRASVLNNSYAKDATEYKITSTPTFYNAIIRGFLWDIGFHYSPVLPEDVAGLEDVNIDDENMAGKSQDEIMAELNKVSDVLQNINGGSSESKMDAELKTKLLYEQVSNELGLSIIIQ